MRAGRLILVAGVGYRNLRDMSVGPTCIDRLRERDWPAHVVVEDLSFGAVHVLHWLQERPAFDMAVFIGAVRRGRRPGSMHRRDWLAIEPADAVQAAVAEAVTGVIGLDTLLTVLGYFEALPPRVAVFEVEPRDDDWGDEFSPAVAGALEQIEQEVEALVR